MQISYCIKQDQIELCDSPLAEGSKTGKSTEVNLTTCSQPFSVMRITGKINDFSNISYVSSGKTGVIACIQVVKNCYLMEFNTSECMEMDYCRNIVDVRFITAKLPFNFRYLKGGTVRRIDIFLPQSNVESILDQSLISLVQKNGHFVIERTKLKSITRKIESIFNDSYSEEENEKTCVQAAKLVHLIKEWSSKN